jgi:elongation factor 1 alpha-like protein
MLSKIKKPSSSQIPSPATSGAASLAPSRGKTKTSKSTANVLQPAAVSFDQQQFDISCLSLEDKTESLVEYSIPKITIARDKLLADARSSLDGDSQRRKSVSLVVIGSSFE